MLKQKIRCWMEGYQNERASYYISILGSHASQSLEYSNKWMTRLGQSTITLQPCTLADFHSRSCQVEGNERDIKCIEIAWWPGIQDLTDQWGHRSARSGESWVVNQCEGAMKSCHEGLTWWQLEILNIGMQSLKLLSQHAQLTMNLFDRFRWQHSLLANHTQWFAMNHCMTELISHHLKNKTRRLQYWTWVRENFTNFPSGSDYPKHSVK